MTPEEIIEEFTEAVKRMTEERIEDMSREDEERKARETLEENLDQAEEAFDSLAKAFPLPQLSPPAPHSTQKKKHIQDLVYHLLEHVSLEQIDSHKYDIGETFELYAEHLFNSLTIALEPKTKQAILELNKTEPLEEGVSPILTDRIIRSALKWRDSKSQNPLPSDSLKTI